MDEREAKSPIPKILAPPPPPPRSRWTGRFGLLFGIAIGLALQAVKAAGEWDERRRK